MFCYTQKLKMKSMKIPEKLQSIYKFTNSSTTIIYNKHKYNNNLLFIIIIC